MTRLESCDKCGQKASCGEAFRRLGEMQGKSVIRSVLAAFVLPLVIFIAVLAFAQQLLAGHIDSAGFRAVLALLAAVVITLFYAIIFRVVSQRLGRKEK